MLSIGVTKASEGSKEDEGSKEENKSDTATKAGAGARSTAAKAVEKSGAEKSSSGDPASTPSSRRSSPPPGGKGGTRDVDAVKKEQTADVDDETLKEIYGKEHVNIVRFWYPCFCATNLYFARLLANAGLSGRSLSDTLMPYDHPELCSSLSGAETDLERCRANQPLEVQSSMVSYFVPYASV